MASPNAANDIRNYLNGLGVSNVYTDALPPSPINAFAAIEYAGPGATKVHGAASGLTNIAFDTIMLQVVARHTMMQSGRTNIVAIVDALDGLTVTISSRQYTDIDLIGRPRLIYTEESGASVWGAEFRLQVRR